ncbi:MAG TPA: RecQ family ATP-dependent DNA helicase [Solirubrobacterales bacterium]|nr:RecQ family ATP-dependent DNA helicase [Solirubrobacterales bacterium]
MPKPRHDAIDRTAREKFGFEALRPGQREAIGALLTGQDTLAVLASGAGKSAIYQIAALLLERSTVVFSPLIALQQDQVESIDENLPGEAAPLNSRLGERSRRRTLRRLEAGEVEFLFLAPEQLAKAEVRDELEVVAPSMIVVDEAHCISQWGHDFRPDYLRIGPMIEQLGHPVTLALTATAAPPVRHEIVERLGMRDPCTFVRGFDRPNIRLAVELHYEARDRDAALRAHVGELPKPGIVYVATHRDTEQLANELAGDGVSAAAYHAGLGTARRQQVQDRFMADALDVVVATTAFGMGVDKPNVRFVLHHGASESLDSYYQEIGRAGRDGAPAKAILLYRPADFGTRRFLRGTGPLTTEELEEIARALAHARAPVEAGALRERLHLSRAKLTAAVNRLQDAGEVETDADGRLRRPRGAPAVAKAVEAVMAAEEAREAFAESRLAMVRAYAEHDGCRRQLLLSYFGEAAPDFCGRCDFCERLVASGRAPRGTRDQPSPAAGAANEDGLLSGLRVRHPAWGEGEVQRLEAEQVVVLFDTVGYKTLARSIVSERGLLVPVDRNPPADQV